MIIFDKPGAAGYTSAALVVKHYLPAPQGVGFCPRETFR